MNLSCTCKSTKDASTHLESYNHPCVTATTPLQYFIFQIIGKYTPQHDETLRLSGKIFQITFSSNTAVQTLANSD